jgi:hypothetical protein
MILKCGIYFPDFTIKLKPEEELATGRIPV